MADTLKADLDEALGAARRWLEAQTTPGKGSGEWYALNNFRGFIDAVETDPSAGGIERASHALGWHIADQYGTDDCWQTISAFSESIRRIGKEIAWQESRQSPADG